LPSYEQAKRGAGQAAFEVVQELVKPEKIPFVFDTVVPVMQFDRDKPNALPIVYAAAIAKHFEAYLETGVRQVNVVSHTFADAQTRILGQPIFMGKIQTGSRVLIVDDVVTYGSTLANLRGWLEKQGASVIGAQLSPPASAAQNSPFPISSGISCWTASRAKPRRSRRSWAFPPSVSRIRKQNIPSWSQTELQIKCSPPRLLAVEMQPSLHAKGDKTIIPSRKSLYDTMFSARCQSYLSVGELTPKC
jgi:hypothetical protein